MLQYALKKEDFDRFIDRVMKEYGFVAPVMPNSTKQFSKSSFQKINSPKEIHL